MSATIKMRPLKIGLIFGAGTMFGVLMSRGAQRFHCHKAATAGHHPWRCPKQAQKKEVGEGTPAVAVAPDEATLANSN